MRPLGFVLKGPISGQITVFVEFALVVATHHYHHNQSINHYGGGRDPIHIHTETKIRQSFRFV